MAGICCGISVSDNEQTCTAVPAVRTASRRRMELRQLKLISDMAETRIKRRKVDGEHLESAFRVDKPPAREILSDLVTETAEMEVVAAVEDSPKFGVTSVCGRRRDMEDSVSIRPSFCRNDGFHFYGVFDGHGCSHVAKKCKEMMYKIVKEEIESREMEKWPESMAESFSRMDKEVGERVKLDVGTSLCRCELQSPQCDAVGSTAVVAVVTPEKIVVSNSGDSRAVLCRNGVAIPLSSDHKPDRPDELARIEEAGGRVIFWDGPRVLGMLAMSRAIGDNYLKPYVIPDPEVTVTARSVEDEFLILASDGLWDVVSNETAASVAQMCLKNAKVSSGKEGVTVQAVDSSSSSSLDKACSDASMLLTKLALARHSADNVSVIVVDLRKK